MTDSLYTDTQREAREKVEAAHQWGESRVSTARWPLQTFRICKVCGHSDVYAIANGLVTCTGAATFAAEEGQRD